jgi:GNAT superfamily N-acetyltransferase
MKDLFFVSREHGFNQFKYIIKTGLFLSNLITEYPQHYEWFAKMVFKINNGKERDILLCQNETGKIIGTSILKRTNNERKICTLRVDSLYQRHGIGRKLFLKSFEWLETEKPIISVSCEKLEQFEKIFKYFNFKVEQVCSGLYKQNRSEYVFNGELREQTLLNKPFPSLTQPLLVSSLLSSERKQECFCYGN